jgi:formate-dependent nitrite reductase membrane component NrfD
MAIKPNNTPDNTDKMAISRKGLWLMVAGLVVLAAGFILLSGGGSKDPAVFNYAMFDFRRLVAAPVVIVAALVVELIGIMGWFKEKKK